MLPDQARSFDLLYAESRKAANVLADGAIREMFLGTPESEIAIHHTRFERLLNWFRFQPTVNALKAGLIMCLTLLGSALAARFLRPHLGPASEWIYLIPALLVEVFCLTYIPVSLLLPDRVWSAVSVTARRRLTARMIVDGWVGRGLRLEELLPSFGASTAALRARRAQFSGLVFLTGTFATFFDFFAGQQISGRGGLFALLGLSPGYRVAAFCSLFTVSALAAFITTLAPLNWRQQLKPHLVREVQRRGAQNSEAEGA
jgi:hypothetical protein